MPDHPRFEQAVGIALGCVETKRDAETLVRRLAQLFTQEIAAAIDGEITNCKHSSQDDAAFLRKLASTQHRENCNGSGEVFPHPPDERDGYVQAEQCRGCAHPDCPERRA